MEKEHLVRALQAAFEKVAELEGENWRLKEAAQFFEAAAEERERQLKDPHQTERPLHVLHGASNVAMPRFRGSTAAPLRRSATDPTSSREDGSMPGLGIKQKSLKMILDVMLSGSAVGAMSAKKAGKKEEQEEEKEEEEEAHPSRFGARDGEMELFVGDLVKISGVSADVRKALSHVGLSWESSMSAFLGQTGRVKTVQMKEGKQLVEVQLGSGADGPSMSIGVSALELLGDEEEEDEARRDDGEAEDQNDEDEADDGHVYRVNETPGENEERPDPKGCPEPERIRRALAWMLRMERVTHHAGPGRKVRDLTKAGKCATGIVTKVGDNSTCDVKYDDGSARTGVPLKQLRPLEQAESDGTGLSYTTTFNEFDFTTGQLPTGVEAVGEGVELKAGRGGETFLVVRKGTYLRLPFKGMRHERLRPGESIPSYTLTLELQLDNQHPQLEHPWCLYQASFPEVHESDELCLVAKARQEAEKSEPVLATEGVGFFRHGFRVEAWIVFVPKPLRLFCTEGTARMEFPQWMVGTDIDGRLPVTLEMDPKSKVTKVQTSVPAIHHEHVQAPKTPVAQIILLDGVLLLTAFVVNLKCANRLSTGPRDLFLGLTQTSSAELCGAVRSKSSAGLGRVAAWQCGEVQRLPSGSRRVPVKFKRQALTAVEEEEVTSKKPQSGKLGGGGLMPAPTGDQFDLFKAAQEEDVRRTLARASWRRTVPPTSAEDEEGAPPATEERYHHGRETEDEVNITIHAGYWGEGSQAGCATTVKVSSNGIARTLTFFPGVDHGAVRVEGEPDADIGFSPGRQRYHILHLTMRQTGTHTFSISDGGDCTNTWSMDFRLHGWLDDLYGAAAVSIFDPEDRELELGHELTYQSEGEHKLRLVTLGTQVYETDELDPQGWVSFNRTCLEPVDKANTKASRHPTCHLKVKDRVLEKRLYPGRWHSLTVTVDSVRDEMCLYLDGIAVDKPIDIFESSFGRTGGGGGFGREGGKDRRKGVSEGPTEYEAYAGFGYSFASPFAVPQEGFLLFASSSIRSMPGGTKLRKAIFRNSILTPKAIEDQYVSSRHKKRPVQIPQSLTLAPIMKKKAIPLWVHGSYVAEFCNPFVPAAGGSPLHLYSIFCMALDGVVEKMSANSLWTPADVNGCKRVLGLFRELELLMKKWHQLWTCTAADQLSALSAIYLRRLAQARAELQPGGRLLVPLGIRLQRSSQLLMLIVERKGSGNYRFLVVNSSPIGLAYHATDASRPPKIRYRVALELDDIPAARAEDEGFWMMLVVTAVQPCHDQLPLYDKLLPWLAGSPLEHLLATVNPTSPATQEWRSPQCANTDGWRYLTFSLRVLLLEVGGFSSSKAKLLKWHLREQLLSFAANDLAAAQSLSVSEKRLLRLGLSQLSLAAVKVSGNLELEASRGVKRDPGSLGSVPRERIVPSSPPSEAAVERKPRPYGFEDPSVLPLLDLLGGASEPPAHDWGLHPFFERLLREQRSPGQKVGIPLLVPINLLEMPETIPDLEAAVRALRLAEARCAKRFGVFRFAEEGERRGTWKNHNRTEHSPEAVGLAGFVQRSEAERSSALEKELCAKLCFVGYERCKFSNFLRVALLQHVFTELMPLPLGPLAEKPPLNLTDPAAWTVREGEDEVWAPNGSNELHPQLTRGGQLELMQVLLRLAEHFVSAACGLHASGGFDGVKIVVLGAIAAIADRVLRIRTVLPGPVEDDTAGVSRTVGLARPSTGLLQTAVTVTGGIPKPQREGGPIVAEAEPCPSLVSDLLNGVGGKGWKPMDAIDPTSFMRQSETIEAVTPEISVARTAVASYFTEVKKNLQVPSGKDQTLFDWDQHGWMLWVNKESGLKKLVQTICSHHLLQAGGGWADLAAGSDPYLVHTWPEFQCYRDIIFYWKYFLCTDLRVFPKVNEYVPQSAYLKWQVVDEQKAFGCPPNRGKVFLVSALGKEHLLKHDVPPHRPKPPASGLRWPSAALPSHHTKTPVRTEDDLLYMRSLPTFNEMLRASDSEVQPPALLSFLTVPYIRMPLVLAFFTTGDRVNSLFDQGLQQILQAERAVILEPGKLLEPMNWAAAPENVPANSSAEQELVASPYGQLLTELACAPGCLLAYLAKLLELALVLANSAMSQTVGTILFTLRVAARVESSAVYLLQHSEGKLPSTGPRPGALPSSAWLLHELRAGRERLRAIFAEAEGWLDAWLEELHDLACKAAAAAGVLFQLVGITFTFTDRKVPEEELDERSVSRILSSFAFLSLHHTFNQNFLDIPETELFEIFQHHRKSINSPLAALALAFQLGSSWVGGLEEENAWHSAGFSTIDSSSSVDTALFEWGVVKGDFRNAGRYAIVGPKRSEAERGEVATTASAWKHGGGNDNAWIELNIQLLQVTVRGRHVTPLEADTCEDGDFVEAETVQCAALLSTNLVRVEYDTEAGRCRCRSSTSVLVLLGWVRNVSSRSQPYRITRWEGMAAANLPFTGDYVRLYDMEDLTRESETGSGPKRRAEDFEEHEAWVPQLFEPVRPEGLERLRTELGRGSPQRRELLLDDAPAPGAVEEEGAESEPPPVRILLLAFLIMFQGYGVMNGNPAHALKTKLELRPDQAGAFQDATAAFQLSKLLMRVLQISLLAFLQPNGIVYLSYAVMFVAILIPIIFVWGADMKDLSIVYLQYTLGGIAIGLFEGTFLSVISVLGKNTKTFAIMGAPLGFAVHNILLGSLVPKGFEVIYYVYSVACIPFAVVIFHRYAPRPDVNSDGKGCQVFLRSLRQPNQWLPAMIPWFIAKFFGNFVMEDAFPLLYSTFNTEYVPVFGPASTSPKIPFKYYTSLYWFVLMAFGDTISRRVPQFLHLRTWRSWGLWIVISIILCIGGEALNFLLIPIVTGVAAGVAYFGNGLIYGLSAKYIDAHVPLEHRYTSYNLWCFAGDLAGYAGQGHLSVEIARSVCEGRHYTYVCHEHPTSTRTSPWD
ncbi:Mycosubtilin synthase subunit A [Durusdinium trenchii]|uniref:Mycosubtilin synthase subunit A n=1 Tax=Durusdinium trenchii TaxID=1381693 RepID=A0ABP0LXE9_9DINO